MSKTLRHLAEHCQGDDRPHCPIIEAFPAGTKRGRPSPGGSGATLTTLTTGEPDSNGQPKHSRHGP